MFVAELLKRDDTPELSFLEIAMGFGMASAEWLASVNSPHKDQLIEDWLENVGRNAHELSPLLSAKARGDVN